MNLLSFNGESTNVFLDQATYESLSGDRISFVARRGDILVFKVDQVVGRKLNRPEGAEHYFANMDMKIEQSEPFGKAICEVQFDLVESMLMVMMPSEEARPAARGRKPRSLSGGGAAGIADLVRQLNAAIDDETMTVSLVDNRIRISMQVTYE